MGVVSIVQPFQGWLNAQGACVQGRCPWLSWFSLSGWDLVASGLPFSLPTPFPVTHTNSH